MTTLIKTRIKFLKPYFFVVMLSLFLVSCKKEAIIKACENNCKDYKVSGRVYDITSGMPLKDFVVASSLNYVGYCIFCPTQTYFIKNQKTDASGMYNYTFTIDSSYTQTNYALQTEITTGDNYRVIVPYYNYTSDTTVNQFPLFPLTDLKLHIKRTQQDPVSSWVVGITYYSDLEGNGQRAYDRTLYFTTPANNYDTTVLLRTTQKFKTRIELRKSDNNNVSTIIRDSIYCTAVGPNVVNINF